MKHRKPNNSITFMKNAAAAANTYRDVLKGYVVFNDCVISANGYVMHVDYTPDDTVRKEYGNHGINIETYKIKETKYPDVSGIINAKPNYPKFVCSPVEFIKALKICKVFVNSKDEDRIVITADSETNIITLYSKGDNGDTTVTITGQVNFDFKGEYKIYNLYKAITCMKLESLEFFASNSEEFPPLYMLAENALYKRMAVVMPLIR